MHAKSLTVSLKLEFQKKNDPFKDLQEQLDTLAVHAPDFFPEGTTVSDVVSADDHHNQYRASNDR